MSKTPAVKPAITLCALRAGELVRVAGELPDRLLVAPWGTHAIGARGQAIVAEATAKVFADNMVALKRSDHVCLDFNHNSLPGHASYLAEQEPRKIAATGKPELVPDKGVFLTGLTWTPEGKAAWEGGHFQDLSPAVYRDTAGNVIALHSVALCQHGEIDGLTIEAATQTALSADIAALSSSPSLPLSSSDSPMKPTASLIALLAALGVTLAADADEATVDTALTDLTAKIKAGTETEIKAKPEGMSALEARLKTVEDERDTIKRDRLKERATNEGKVIPLTDAIWNVTPLSVCEALVMGLKAGEVPMQRKTPENAELGDKPDALTAETEAVLTKMGLTKEDYAKYGPAAAAAK